MTEEHGKVCRLTMVTLDKTHPVKKSIYNPKTDGGVWWKVREGFDDGIKACRDLLPPPPKSTAFDLTDPRLRRVFSSKGGSLNQEQEEAKPPCDTLVHYENPKCAPGDVTFTAAVGKMTAVITYDVVTECVTLDCASECTSPSTQEPASKRDIVSVPPGYLPKSLDDALRKRYDDRGDTRGGYVDLDELIDEGFINDSGYADPGNVATWFNPVQDLIDYGQPGTDTDVGVGGKDLVRPKGDKSLSLNDHTAVGNQAGWDFMTGGVAPCTCMRHVSHSVYIPGAYRNSQPPPNQDVAEVYSSKKGSSNLTTPSDCVLMALLDNVKCNDFDVDMDVVAERVGNTLIIEWVTTMTWWVTFDFTSYCELRGCEGTCFPSGEEKIFGDIVVSREFKNQSSSELAGKYGLDIINKTCANPPPPYGDGKTWSDKVKDMMDKPFEPHPLSDSHYDLVQCEYKGAAGKTTGPRGTGLKKPFPDGHSEPGDWFAPGGIDKGEMLDSEDWKALFPGMTAGTPQEQDVSHIPIDDYPKGLFGPCQCIGQRYLSPITHTDSPNFTHINQQADDPEDVLILELPGLVYVPHYFTHTNSKFDEGI